MLKTNLNTSFFDTVGSNYSDDLSVEIAELQRTIYLPLLPMEQISIKVLQAYEDLGRTYWTKDDVYTSEIGNFYIPMLFPMVENVEESAEMIHKEPNNRNVKSSDIGYGVEKYITRSFVELLIPKHIVLQFTDTIPRGTKFNVGFIGGSTTLSNIKILSVAEMVDTGVTQFNTVYNLSGLPQATVTAKVQEDLKLIDQETANRNKIKEDYEDARSNIINNKTTRRRSYKTSGS
jgi:hypothetical protein